VVAVAAPATAVPLAQATEKIQAATKAPGKGKVAAKNNRTVKRVVAKPVPKLPAPVLPFVTIVDQDPSGVLAIDVALQHH
jgi:hypothetical protein